MADRPYDTHTKSDRAYYRQLCVLMMNRCLPIFMCDFFLFSMETAFKFSIIDDVVVAAAVMCLVHFDLVQVILAYPWSDFLLYKRFFFQYRCYHFKVGVVCVAIILPLSFRFPLPCYQSLSIPYRWWHIITFNWIKITWTWRALTKYRILWIHLINLRRQSSHSNSSLTARADSTMNPVTNFDQFLLDCYCYWIRVLFFFCFG